MSNPESSIIPCGIRRSGIRWSHAWALLVLVLLASAARPLHALDVVNISATTAGANEQGEVPGHFIVSRSGSTGTLTVNFSVAGSAALTTDYTTTQFSAGTGTIAFVQGETTRSITITPVDDADIEGKETISIALTPDAAYIVGPFPSAQLDLGDNDMVARIEIEDPRADEDTALSGYVNDLEIH